MKKAVIYARYSTDMQRVESIQAQVRACEDYAKSKGIIIIKHYIDEARSATNDNREQFLKMIDASYNQVFDFVLVHKLDRFARNRFDSAIYRKKLRDNGVKLVSILEQFGDSPESILLESLVEGMAEYYSANLARETMKGLKENAYQCKFNGGTPPLGYNIDKDGKFVLNDDEAVVVQNIFEFFAQGYSYKDITEHLNKKGLRTKKGNPFSKNGLHEILSNERYVGIYMFNVAPKKLNGKFNKRNRNAEKDIIKIPGGIPRIISDELFERVKYKMSISTGKRNNAQGKAKLTYLLTGLAFCGECGSAMVGNRKTRGDKVYGFYECGGRKRKHDCNLKSKTKTFLEETVISELEAKVLNPTSIDTLSELVLEHADEQLQDVKAEAIKIAEELKEVQSQINRIVDAVISGLNHPSFKQRMDDLETKKAELQSLLFEAENQSENYFIDKDMVSEYLKVDLNFKAKPEEDQKRTLNKYIKKINIYHDKIDVNIVVDTTGCGTRI